MLVLGWIRRLYKVLSADASPEAVAFAAALGLAAGFLPFASGMTLVVLLVILVFRVQISTAIGFWGIGALIRAAGGAALFESVGESILETEALRGFWTWFLNLRVVAWLDLDIYAISGGAAAGFVLGIAVFFPVRYLVIAYRRWAHERLSKNRFFRWLTSFWVTKLVGWVFVGGKS